ncbi:MAG: CPXCG motif-containing cysteine-rich protein, partial [Cyanobacteria bacterium J06642_11]
MGRQQTWQSSTYCGEPSTTFIDISGGLTQQYVEDCQVCCRPNILYITIDED